MNLHAKNAKMKFSQMYQWLQHFLSMRWLYWEGFIFSNLSFFANKFFLRTKSFDFRGHLIIITAVPVNCVGQWTNSTCSKTCGNGGSLTMTYTIITAAANGGTQCPYVNRQTRTSQCNTNNISCRMFAIHDSFPVLSFVASRFSFDPQNYAISNFLIPIFRFLSHQ